VGRWRHSLDVVRLSGREQRVVDKAARERRVLPVDAKRFAWLARVAIDVAAGKEQDRNRLAGNPP